MIPVEEAQRRILDRIRPLEPATMRFDEALGFVLAEDIHAAENMPPFAAAAKDGFAVVASDTSRVRRLVGEQMAGTVSGPRVEPGTVVRITTGAPIPPGADAVVMVERTEEQNGRVIIHQETIEPGADIRPPGQDIQKGQLVLKQGTRLGPAEIGLLATIGCTSVKVYRRPTVAVLSTGDELVEPDESPGPGQIRDSNRYTLAAAVAEAGGIPLILGLSRDVETTLEELMLQGLEQADALLTSGGVSMGDKDLVKPILERLGTVHFGRVYTKPGKPVTFATVNGKPVFAMPGFPVSSLVSFEIFVRPALRRMQGYPERDLFRPERKVILEHDVHHTADRTEFQRAIVTYRDGQFYARTTGFQGSGRLLSMVGANALLRLPHGEGNFKRGDLVSALVIGDIF
ncbi:MAG: molybdopterin molybdenumtransferase MoeA [Chloroflexi bacterium]|nr:MAG: molybdopterin molybdenumtransferase MoeA [Chloroflexota bacterium]